MKEQGFLQENAHYLLRLILASVFLFHGIGKLVDVSGFARMMDMNIVVAWLVTAVELLAGAGILAGGLLNKDSITRLSGVMMAPVLLGAIALVHWPRWSFTPSESHPMGGMEYQVSLLLLALYFVIVGNGRANQ